MKKTMLCLILCLSGNLIASSDLVLTSEFVDEEVKNLESEADRYCREKSITDEKK